MLIRKACSGDIESIHKLDRESTAYHQKFDKDFYTISHKWWKIKEMSQCAAMKDATNLILVAEDNGMVVGYVWGYVENIAKLKIGKIQDLIVTKRYRRKGAATALIKDLLIFFRNKKCVLSETVANVENKTAIKVFNKIGFDKKEYKMCLKLDKTKKIRPFV